MPLTFVFDTNYVRSFSQNDFLSGQVPARLAQQIKDIASRGYSIAVLETVRLEVNAWLSKAVETRDADLKQSIVKLTEAGYLIDSSSVAVRPELDFFDLMKSVESSCFLMLPDIEDYREAERRTSFRLPPHPKNIEGEEMRDRVIWCQLVNYCEKTSHNVVLVSGDNLFRNGAATEEAINLGIECVADGDLDQRIGMRSAHITEIISMLESFNAQLKDHGIILNGTTIASLEELRKINEADGTVTLKFIILSNSSGLPVRCGATLSALGSDAYFIQIETESPIAFSRMLETKGSQELARFSNVSIRIKEFSELKNIVEH